MGRARLSPALGLLACCAAPADGMELAGSEAALRPDDPSASELLHHFAAGESVESHDGPAGKVRVHFTREGVNAVEPGGVAGDATPPDVVAVAELYEAVLEHLAALGFRAPLSDLGTAGGDGGDARFDVYLLDFGSRADGSFVREACAADAPSRCSGYAVQENDFAGYRYPDFATGTRVLASHELFHAVQAAYDADQGANFAEATAVWASERFDPALSDFEAQIEGWLAHPERSIDQEPITPVDPYSYGLGLYVQYLDERFGPALIREIWEGCEDGAGGVSDPRWVDVLEARLGAAHGTSFHDSWLEFARWVLHSGFEGTAGSSFAGGARYPRVARTPAALPFVDERLRMFHASLRAFSFEPGQRAELAVELLADPSELEGLSLLAGLRRGDALASLDARIAAEGEWRIDVAGADEVVVIVANGAARGESKLPALCVGSQDELAACRAALAGADADAGVADAGAPESGDVSDGGCAVCSREPSAPAAWLLALGALWLAVRRRARG
jgi:hypothetical protein